MVPASTPTALSRRGLAWFVAIQCASTAANLAFLPPNTDAPFAWIPTALAIAFFCRAPRRQWPLLSALFLLCHLGLFLHSGTDPLAAAGSNLASLAEALLSAWLVRWPADDRRPIGLASLSRALGLLAFVCIPVGAAFGAWIQWWRLGLDWNQVFWHWWGGDLSGTIFVVLPYLACGREAIDNFRHKPLTHAGWSVLFGTFTAITLAWVPFPFPYVALPLGLAAFRFGAFRISVIGNFTFLVCGILFKMGWIRMPSGYPAAGAEGLFASGMVTFLGTFLIGMLADQMRFHREQAQRSEQRLRDALALSGTGYAIVNLDTTIKEANPYLCKLLGATHEQMLGQSIQVASLPQDKEIAASRLERLLSGEVTCYAVERELSRVDGTHVWARVTVAKPPSFKDDFFLQVHDISADKQALRSLEEARLAAEEAYRVKTEFVANMSHEIRTPLNGIIGLSEILTRSELPDEAWKTAQLIHRSGKALAGVVHSILDFSRLESGKIELEIGEFDLDELTSTISGIMAAGGARKGLVLAITVEPDVPRRLRGDCLRLQQVLVNLVGNAMKFTEHGEVHARIERRADRQGEFRFSVRDTGVGIPPSLSSRLFDPFTQSDTSNTRRHEGSGLGLAISRQLVELMGGKLEYETHPGIGTEFRFTIPLEEIAGTGIAVEPRPLHPFLVVEPNPTLQGSLDKAFRRLGWPCRILSSTPKLRDILRRSEHSGETWTGILADADLAGMDLLLRDAQDHDLPVVAMDHAYHAEDSAAILPFSVHRILLWPATEAGLRGILEPLFEERNRIPPKLAANAADPVRVLVVEDNPINQVVATGILDQMGVGHKLAEHGLEAVNLLRDDPKFDLILMDIQMPVMDGFTATRVIHKDLGLSIPIVAMTAGVLPRDRARCAENGLDDFLPKPFDFDDMVALLERNLKRTFS